MLNIDAELAGILFTLALNALIFSLCVIIFFSFRYYREQVPFDRRSTQPLLGGSNESDEEADTSPDRRFSVKNRRSVWTLGSSMWSATDEDLMRLCGTDGYLYLKFLRLVAVLLGFLSILSLTVIVPVNLTGHNEIFQKTALDHISADNLPSGSKLMWVLFGMTLVYSVAVFVFLLEYKREVEHLSEPSSVQFEDLDDAIIAAHSIQIRNFPRTLLEDSAVFAYFESDYPNQVVSAHIVPEYTTVYEALQEQEEYSKLLDRFNAYTRATGRRLHITVNKKCCCCGGESKDAISYYEDRVKECAAKAAGLRSLGYTENVGHAFVTFKRSHTARRILDSHELHHTEMLRRSVQAHPILETSSWKIRPAAAPSDIVWSNLPLSDMHKTFRRVLLNLLLFVLFFSVVTPVTILQRLAPFTEKIERYMYNATLFHMFIVDYLPTLLLILINSVLVPVAIDYCAEWERFDLKSQKEKAVLSKNLVFLLINSLFLPMFGLSSIQTFVELSGEYELDAWNKVLGSILLTSSGAFFIRYLIQSTFISNCSQLLAVSELLNTKWREWQSGIPIRSHRIRERVRFDFGYSYASVLSILSMVIVYSIAVPLIVPFGFLFFLLKYTIDKYNFLHIYTVDFESRGDLGKIVYKYCIFVIALLQFIMSGFFVLQASPGFIAVGSVLFAVSLVTMVLLACFPGISFMEIHKRSRRARAATMDMEQNKLRDAYMHPAERLVPHPSSGLGSSSSSSRSTPYSSATLNSNSRTKSRDGRSSNHSPAPLSVEY